MADEPARVEAIKKRKTWGIYVAAFTGSVAVGLCLISAPFVTPALRKYCLPYVPATNRQIENVITLCKHGGRSVNRNSNNLRLVDLGSGDGRIALAAAKHGFTSTGIELNPWLVFCSRIAARLNGLSQLATFERKDLWKVDLSTYDRIVIFGVAEMMPALQDKLRQEVKPGASVIACRFPMPNWVPAKSLEEGIDSVWLYSSDDFNCNQKSI
eukprot:gene18147-19957_t